MESEKESIKYTRKVYLETNGAVRKLRCFNILHHVDNENADDIIKEKLGYNLDDYDNDLLGAVLAAHTKFLQRTIPEVIIEIIGSIDEDDIEDMLCNEISEATGWLHEGFQFEEIK